MSKRLVGGVILLCLTALTLNVSESEPTYENITEPEILEQLTNLKKYIPNPHMIKPVWVQLKNDDTDEIVVVQGELKVVDTGEFEICVQLNGYKLIISIEFTQALNEDDEPIDDWYIDTNDAKYLFTSDAQNVKATIEDADFGDVALAGDLSVGGDLSVTGKVNGKIAFEDIEDANGHKRFVDIDFTPNEITGFTSVYAKASLSGTHLLIVLAGNVVASTTIADGTNFANVTLPKWILDKIYPIQAEVVCNQSVVFYKENQPWVTESKTLTLTKETSGSDVTLKIRNVIGAQTITNNSSFRIAFDLLIDNETNE